MSATKASAAVIIFIARLVATTCSPPAQARNAYCDERVLVPGSFWIPPPDAMSLFLVLRRHSIDVRRRRLGMMSQRARNNETVEHCDEQTGLSRTGTHIVNISVIPCTAVSIFDTVCTWYVGAAGQCAAVHVPDTQYTQRIVRARDPPPAFYPFTPAHPGTGSRGKSAFKPFFTRRTGYYAAHPAGTRHARVRTRGGVLSVGYPGRRTPEGPKPASTKCRSKAAL